MKLLFILLTAFASFFAQAAPKDATPAAVLHSFQGAFAGAKEVSWSASSNFYKAAFVLNEQYVTAFYSSNGELVALTRNITSFQLPVALQTTLKKQYSEYWISELFEVASEEGTTYYVTLETADTKLTLQSNLTSWATFQKNHK